ncbi:MAG: hypothetical protein M8467_18210, partial [Anaerolineae bacterium]|nr:hypothetical protein [Anaerolineae bacterium]
MTDRRTVDELSIEELEQILIVKRREARAERIGRLREIGRLPADAALPHEDLAAIPVGASGGGAVLEASASLHRALDVEPLTRLGRRRRGRRQASTSRWGRLRDRFLLLLEVGALVGLVVVVVVSLSNLKALNEDYAEASLLQTTPTAEPTPMGGGFLPSGHTPPEEPGEVPLHLRGLVVGEVPPAVPIPTPGPEAPTRIVVPAIDVDALIVEGD